MKRSVTFLPILAALLLAPHADAQSRHAPPGYREWRVYGGSSESIRYSNLDQINRGNVDKLQVAWTFDTGDAFAGSEMQCNPIVVNGVLYATTPKLRVIALDAATGRLRWSFDPNDGAKITHSIRNRGITYWEDGRDQRIFVVSRHWLYALDAGTGARVTVSATRAASICARGWGAIRARFPSPPPRPASSIAIC